jgi:hypothetical protein
LLIISAAVLVVVVGVVVLMSGDDGKGDDSGDGSSRTSEEQAYVDELAAAMREVPANAVFSDSDVDCMAGAAVDAYGLDELEAVGTPRVVAETNAAELGLPQGHDVADAYMASVEACADIRAIFLTAFQRSTDLAAEEQAALECAFENISGEVLRETIWAIIAGYEPRADHAEAFERAVDACEQ